MYLFQNISYTNLFKLSTNMLSFLVDVSSPKVADQCIDVTLDQGDEETRKGFQIYPQSSGKFTK